MERKNIIFQDDKNNSGGTISVMEFVYDICEGKPAPLMQLVDGSLYIKDGLTYCLKVDDIELDNQAETWYRA